MASPTHRHSAPVETGSGAFAMVAALLLGILVAVLGFFALLMWVHMTLKDMTVEIAPVGNPPGTMSH